MVLAEDYVFFFFFFVGCVKLFLLASQRRALPYHDSIKKKKKNTEKGPRLSGKAKQGMALQTAVLHSIFMARHGIASILLFDCTCIDR